MPFEEVEFGGLKAQMAKYGHTYDDLAELLGFTSRQCVSRRFSGQTKWNIDEIRKLCEMYNKTFEELFN